MCNMCGQCCRMIHFPGSVHRSVQGNVCLDLKCDLYFVQENMEYLGPASEVEGALAGCLNGATTHIYRCRLINKDNKCSIPETKPRVCYGYPYYDSGKSNESEPWPYKGCAYERDSYELRMIGILKKHLNKLKEKEIGHKNENTDSSQKRISGKRIRESVLA